MSLKDFPEVRLATRRLATLPTSKSVLALRLGDEVRDVRPTPSRAQELINAISGIYTQQLQNFDRGRERVLLILLQLVQVVAGIGRFDTHEVLVSFIGEVA